MVEILLSVHQSLCLLPFLYMFHWTFCKQISGVESILLNNKSLLRFESQNHSQSSEIAVNPGFPDGEQPKQGFGQGRWEYIRRSLWWEQKRQMASPTASQWAGVQPSRFVIALGSGRVISIFPIRRRKKQNRASIRGCACLPFSRANNWKLWLCSLPDGGREKSGTEMFERMGVLRWWKNGARWGG